MRNRLLWFAAALSLASMLALAYYLQGPPPVRVGPDWTPERFAAELEKTGDKWEVHSAPGGLLLRRPGGPAWETLLDELAARPHHWGERPGVVYVGTAPGRESTEIIDALPGTLSLQRLLIRGHPEDVRAIAQRFTSQ